MASSRMPLYLFEVLEEEFISLHSRGLRTEVVAFPHPTKANKTRPITANLDYLFHPSHIKDPYGFVSELLLRDSAPRISGARTSAISNIAPSDWTRIGLIKVVRDLFDQQTLDILRRFNTITSRPSSRTTGPLSLDAAMQTTSPAPGTPALEQRLEEQVREQIAAALNTLLTKPELYQPERFSSHWFSPETRRLVSSVSDSNSVDFSPEDLIHFNRLLLEDAFPETFEKIHEIRLAAMYKRLHAVKQNALCLSGGGIRSGTFALGVMQGLARHDLLKNFHYLSTVSGGGYIGSWLTAWIHRHPEGLVGVTKELANLQPKSKIDPDSAPVRHLRSYSNFITPQVGLLSADTWSFVGIYLRNLVLNWIVFIPLLLAVLMLPRINLAAILAQPSESVRVAFSIFNLNLNFVGRHIFLFLGFLLGSWSLAYVTFNRPSVREELRRRRQFWRARSNQSSFLIYCLLPLVSAAFCLTIYWGWSTESVPSRKSFLVMGAFGFALTSIAWIISTAVLGRFSPGNRKDIDSYEFGVLSLAGFVGGCLLGFGSLISTLGQPVIRLTKETMNSPHWLSWSEDSYWNWLNWKTELYACLAVPVFLLIFLLAATVFVGVSSRSARVDDEDREWWARFGAWAFIAIVSWVAANGLVIFGPIVLLSAPKTLVSISGISGLVSILLGRSAKTPANEEPLNKRSTKSGLLGSLIGRSLPLMALIFIAALLASLSLATTGIFQGLALLNNEWPKTNLVWLVAVAGVKFSPVGLAAFAVVPALPKGVLPTMIQGVSWFSPFSVIAAALFKGMASLQTRDPYSFNAWLTTVDFQTYLSYIYPAIKVPNVFNGAKIVHMNILHHSSIWAVSCFGAIFFVFGMFLSQVINLNLFSLHAGYRNRLIRGFLGASRPDHERRPNPFTGFDPLDNLAMHELRPALFVDTDFLEPLQLLTLLRDRTNEVSDHLATNNLLLNINSLPKINTASPRLIAALRKDLNGALQTEDLVRFSKGVVTQNMLMSAGSVRSTKHILLNRSVLEENYPKMFRPLSSLEPYKLMPLINTTLNLVGSDNLAWQQRKAEPFTVTPLHAGCFRVGYRDAREYGGSSTGGISLGTAAAISGAAASSNMGYYTTSPVISLLLTFFNVRLGWWLGNPGPAGASTFRLRAPKYSVGPVLDEALGLTDDTNKYVYLSDGGHFENLAIYEMVLRRCHIIIVSDAAQDKDYRFTDLGNAIRKIRIDLGIPIDFWNVPIRTAWPQEGGGMYWAVGRIRYSCIDGQDTDGLLLYVKPAVYGTEPRDVLEYKKSFPDFPHQTTADQFFDEPQFESYRALGSHIMDQMCGIKNTGQDICTMIERAVNRVAESDDTDPRLEKWARGWIAKERQAAKAKSGVTV